jgi:hypothetical protein
MAALLSSSVLELLGSACHPIAANKALQASRR